MNSSRTCLSMLALMAVQASALAQLAPVGTQPSPLPAGSVWSGMVMCGAQRWDATLRVDARDVGAGELVGVGEPDKANVRVKLSSRGDSTLDIVPANASTPNLPFDRISGTLRLADTREGFRQARIVWRPADGPMPPCRPVLNLVDAGGPDAARVEPTAGAGTGTAATPAQAGGASLWKLTSEAAKRTLFNVVELGGRLNLPNCQANQGSVLTQPCAIPVGQYAQYQEFGLMVHFVYLPSLPEWVRPAPNGLRLGNCAEALPSRQQGCREEQARLLARTPPRPGLIAVTHKDHVVEVLFYGPDSLCDVGGRVFEQKWGKPSFVNNAGTNVDWTFEDFGASILCVAVITPQPLRHIIGDGLPSRMAQYTARLIAPFQSFGRTQQFQQDLERQRIGTTGPKL